MPNLKQDVIDAAKASQRRWGIPASVTLAQYGLESGWGSKTSGENNYFGIKGAGTKVVTHEVINGKRVQQTLEFKDYNSVSDCFDDHGRILNLSVYAKARKFLPDPLAFAHALTGVYATAPNYGDVLENIINGSHLKGYDI